MTATLPIGIDLGTTHSAVAHFDARGRSVLLRNSAGELLTPSVVLFDDDEVIVGREAAKAARSLPDRVAFGAKRDMGRAHYAHPVRGHLLPPETIAAAILGHLRDETVDALEDPLAAVVTVPAYFDEVRRRATRNAADLAGWNVIDLVTEPTAAALAWCEQIGYFDDPQAFDPPRTLLVYDLGGGTLDVTLIEVAPQSIRTLATDGDFCLGGIDWDERLVNYAAEQFLAAHSSDPRSDEFARWRLLAEAEQAKQTLTQRTSTAMQIEHAGQSLRVSITREQFELLTEDLLERTAFTTRQLLAAAGREWGDLSQILLVGGSSRMPMVARGLETVSGLTPILSATCDEDVARGAALFARHQLQSRPNDAAPTLNPAAPPVDASPAASPRVWTPPTLPAQGSATVNTTDDRLRIIDVNSHSLGIQGIDRETLERENVILIPRNTPLPAAKSDLFTTRTVDQRTIVIQVLEGEQRRPEQCAMVAQAVMRNLPPGLPEGTPVEVTYRYDRNGLLTVEARLTVSGEQLRIEVQRDTGLSEEGFSRWRDLWAVGSTLHGWEPWRQRAEQVTQDETIAAAEPPATGDSTQSAEIGVYIDSDDPSSEHAVLDAVPSSDEFTGVATSDSDESVSENYREQQEMRRQAGRRRLLVNVIGHVIASGTGLFLGYIILCWLSPRADFLHIFHD